MIFGIRKWPIVPTIIVLAAVAVMVRLGFWQLDRLAEKEALLAEYEASAGRPELLPEFPFMEPASEFYQRAELTCFEVVDWSAVAGRSSNDEPGYFHVANCRVGYIAIPESGTGEIVIGWSRSPENPVWEGGDVVGIIGPGGENGWRLVADPPLAGLEANAMPDPNDIPNNHLAYAVQWFFFALTALVIYVLALRRQNRARV